MCLHASWMNAAVCTVCKPLPVPQHVSPSSAPKRAPLAPGTATPTDDIDPLSVPTFEDTDPRGMTATEGILHRNGEGQAIAKVKDLHGRTVTCTIPRAVWALAAAQGFVAHASAHEDILHVAGDCAAEITADNGCRYSCTDWRHFQKRSRREVSAAA